MINSLSILIPCHNCGCTELVKELARQCGCAPGLEYEIVIADDGSTDEKTIAENRELENLAGVRYVACEKSKNRSQMRNRLATLARYEWQLQINGNVAISNISFISVYLGTQGEVVCGGTTAKNDTTNLRAKYEYAFAEKLDTKNAESNWFRNTNCLYHSGVFASAQYDESIDGYGYEDLLFGEILRANGIEVKFIDNPVEYSSYETNDEYLRKTEESLHTLKQLSERLASSSRLLKTVSRLETLHLSPLVRLWHNCFKGIERRNLCGNNPSLKVFSIYKLGYYLNIK